MMTTQPVPENIGKEVEELRAQVAALKSQLELTCPLLSFT